MDKSDYAPKQPLLTEVTEYYYRKPAVQPGISIFYKFNAADQHKVPLFLPDNAIDIMFCARADGSDPHFNIYGQRLEPGTLDIINPEYHYFGVRLTPGVRPELLDLSLAETREKNIIDAKDFIKDKSLIEKIITEKDFETQQKIFTQAFCKFQDIEQDSSQMQLFRFLKKSIVASGGHVSIQSMVEESGYSERYIKKVFTNNAAIGPKVFSRIVRFQNLINRLNEDVLCHNNINFTQYAYDLGFSDQAHMIREMKTLSGYTPTEYIKHLHSYNYAERLIRL